ncbi:MAG: Ger(x)C family spore germination protein [Bacillaceae bacterium]|nr:Ger(x)C family spore germination protein [Bacillaceae bacterium]
MNKYKIVLLIYLLIASFLLTSCWNAKELTELSLISAVGIDLGDEEDRYVVSFQLLSAGEIAVGQEGGGRGGSPTLLFTSTGNTLFEAIRKVTQQASRRIYFPHTALIVIGEDFAREEGIHYVLDWFERDHEFRTNVPIVIAKGATAEEILMVQSPVEKVAAKKIARELETSEKAWGEDMVVELGEVISNLLNKGKEVAINGVVPIGDTNKGSEGDNLKGSIAPVILLAKGLGVFKDGKLITWFENETARGVLWTVDKIQSTVINVDCGEKKDAIGIEIIRSTTKVNVKMKEGKPIYHITVNNEGNIGEAICKIDLTNPKTILELEQQLEEEIKSEVMYAIKAAQEVQSDIFGFGSVLNRKHRKEWKKLEDVWPEVFANAQVDVEVNAFIRRTGMRSNSIFPQ